MTNLALIDPNGLSRAALSALLRALGFDPVVDYPKVDDLKRTNGGAATDIVLINLSGEARSTDVLIEQVHAISPYAKVVFLASELDVKSLATCLMSGARGYLLGNISQAALQESLHLVSAGGTVFPAEVAAVLSDLMRPRRLAAGPEARSEDQALSDREVEILQYLVAGEPNKVIAQRLNIAEATVKVHMKNILRKTRANNRTQAALWAVANGIRATPAVSLVGIAQSAGDALL